MSDAKAILNTAPVGEEQAGSRLDRWLAAACPEMSRTRLKGLIAGGAISSGGAVLTDPSQRVRAGQIFAIVVPDSEPAAPAAEVIALDVVYEDADVIVVDKPAGMVVHPAPGSPRATLVNALLAHCGESLSGIGGVRRPGIVHRLDKDTSGLIVAAKNDRAHHSLARQFEERSIERTYHAVCWGVPSPMEGSIEGNIGRSPANRKKMAVLNSGGKTALTRYKVQAVFAGAASLVECRLATGRTHQIRVHLAAVGHPLVGDPVYGRVRAARVRGLPEETARTLREFPRQALHAAVLGFEHPSTGQRLRFVSDMPYDISTLVRTLEVM